ncbi:hypothetical protein [Solirubrum puertoriconensis]|uniref:Lipoprotein n=1 Tax=Solirubrum puertoriconensis TaxID=1751427 RepID=A0A9X0HJH1_SOLP1|nr:hypothetical protein [Solirubrum puertoriconensis]KUG06999.1 hypothetical protein ASU33_06675 [Solirubrum puertoriconensis]
MSRTPYALGTALLLLSALVACDRSMEPGIDHQFQDSFDRAPHATRVDTERDSVSGGGKAYTPVGTTSGARTVAEAVSSQPGGDPNTSKYTETGTTDGSSTTSGRSLTGRGTRDSEIPATDNPPQAGTTSGRGSLNNIPRSTPQNASVQGVQGGGPRRNTDRENSNTSKQDNRD